MKTISPEALDVLRAVTITTAIGQDTEVRLPDGQLDRKVYVEVDGALKIVGGGGRWNKSKRAHLLPRDPSAELKALLDGDAPPRLNALDFYPTPRPIVDRLINEMWAIAPPAAARILEPSAGDGAIADRVREVAPDAELTVIEPDPGRSDVLASKGYEPVRSTFEAFVEANADARFDIVLMNPPFRSDADGALWMSHLTMAWELLDRGGSLAAIVPNGFAFRQDKKHVAIRELVDENGNYFELPENAFRESGTGIRTCLVTMWRSP